MQVTWNHEWKCIYYCASFIKMFLYISHICSNRLIHIDVSCNLSIDQWSGTHTHCTTSASLFFPQLLFSRQTCSHLCRANKWVLWSHRWPTELYVFAWGNKICLLVIEYLEQFFSPTMKYSELSTWSSTDHLYISYFPSTNSASYWYHYTRMFHLPGDINHRLLRNWNHVNVWQVESIQSTSRDNTIQCSTFSEMNRTFQSISLAADE